MKKKGLFTLVALVLTAITAVSIAYAAWVVSQPSAPNTVKVGEPSIVSLSGGFNNDTIIPGGAAISKTFTIELDSAKSGNYDLVVNSIAFTNDDVAVDNATWTYSTTGLDDYVAFTGTVTLGADVTDGATVTLYLKLAETNLIAADWADYELTFTVSLVE